MRLVKGDMLEGKQEVLSEGESPTPGGGEDMSQFMAQVGKRYVPQLMFRAGHSAVSCS